LRTVFWRRSAPTRLLTLRRRRLILVHLPVLRHGHCLRDLLLQRGRKRYLERIGRARQVVMVDMRVMVVMVRLGHLGLRVWSWLWQRAERVRL
jgi:hypothetical protein